MSVVLLARHGQASFGARSYDRLSDQGRLQVRRLGTVLREREVSVDRIVAGSLRRQQESAAELADVLGASEVELDPRWDEYDYEPLLTELRPAYRRRWVMLADLARSGDPARKLQELLDDALARWVAGELGAQAEPFAAYRQRVEQALGSVASADGTSLVVSSAGTITLAAAGLLGLPEAAWPGMQRVMVNTGLTKIVQGRRGLSLISLNEHGHLEGVPELSITYR